MFVTGEPDSNTRSSEVSSIFDYVYAQYALDKVVTKDTDLGEYDVDKGKVNKNKGSAYRRCNNIT